jgi:hypothetical protein
MWDKESTVADLCQSRNRSNIVFRVADTLYEDCFCFVVNGCGKISRLVGLDKLDPYAEFFESDYVMRVYMKFEVLPRNQIEERAPLN